MSARRRSSAEASYLATSKRAVKAMKDLQDALVEHAGEAGKAPDDWGNAGSMGHAANILEELARFLRGGR